MPRAWLAIGLVAAACLAACACTSRFEDFRAVLTQKLDISDAENAGIPLSIFGYKRVDDGPKPFTPMWNRDVSDAMASKDGLWKEWSPSKNYLATLSKEQKEVLKNAPHIPKDAIKNLPRAVLLHMKRSAIKKISKRLPPRAQSDPLSVPDFDITTKEEDLQPTNKKLMQSLKKELAEANAPYSLSHQIILSNKDAKKVNEITNLFHQTVLKRKAMLEKYGLHPKKELFNGADNGNGRGW